MKRGEYDFFRTLIVSLRSHLDFRGGEAYFLDLKVHRVVETYVGGSTNITCHRVKGKTLQVMRRINRVHEIMQDSGMGFSIETSKNYLTFRQGPASLTAMVLTYNQVLDEEKVVEIFSSLGD